jgi:hypothetical protein
MIRDKFFAETIVDVATAPVGERLQQIGDVAREAGAAAWAGVTEKFGRMTDPNDNVGFDAPTTGAHDLDQ